MIPLIAQEIRRLSQDEGLFDHEIAEILSISRATVNRTRKAHNVPTINLENRLDKKLVCKKCGKEWLVRRKEPVVSLCEECKRSHGPVTIGP